MRVLQINAVYAQRSTGIIVKDINDELIRRGYESHIAYAISNYHPKNGYKIGNKLDYKIHALLTRLLGKQGYFSIISTRRFLRYIDRIKPDIVHLHNLHSNYINLNILLEYLEHESIHTVITLHDCWFFTGKCFHYQVAKCDRFKDSCGDCPLIKKDVPSWFFDPTAKVLSDKKKLFNNIKSLTVVGVSNWISNEAKQGIFKDKGVVTIHNGVDINIFRPTPSEMREKLGLKDEFVILGSADKWLNPLNREAFKYILSSITPDMKIVIFGCNKDQQKQLPESVIGIGYITDRDEMAKLYSMSDVFVNITLEDSLPTVNIEAQACGTPVITYKSGGSPETISERTGIVVPKGDKEGLLKAILKIKDRGKAIYEQNCIDHVEKNFVIKDRYVEYVNLYNNIKERGGT